MADEPEKTVTKRKTPARKPATTVKAAAPAKKVAAKPATRTTAKKPAAKARPTATQAKKPSRWSIAAIVGGAVAAAAAAGAAVFALRKPKSDTPLLDKAEDVIEKIAEEPASHSA